jgi:hypothetical protein
MAASSASPDELFTTLALHIVTVSKSENVRSLLRNVLIPFPGINTVKRHRGHWYQALMSVRSLTLRPEKDGPPVRDDRRGGIHHSSPITHYSLLITHYSALITQHSLLSTQHSALSTQHSALSTILS